MLTKLGASLAKPETSHSYLVLPNFVEGLMIGATRAHDLSRAERKVLEEHYGLPEDANFEIRNGVRGVVGATLGALPGALAHAIVKSKRAQVLSEIAAPLGGFLGAQLMTDKYSSRNARDIMGV